MERKILEASIASRESFDLLEKYDIKESLSDQGRILWEVAREYYNKDNSATSIDREVMAMSVERLYPKHSKMLLTIIQELGDTSPPNLLHEILEQKKHHTKIALAEALTSDKATNVDELMAEYDRLVGGEIEAAEDTEVLVAPDLSSIMSRRGPEGRIKVLPQVLNEALDGGPLPGHHILVFAPTEMGKTLFIINMIRGLLLDGRRVLYVMNEDPMSDLVERFLVCMTGRDKHEVRKNVSKAEDYVRKRGYNNLIWADLAPGTLGEINSLIEEHKPEVLIVDQIRNLNTKEKHNVQALEKIAKGMRNFAKKYNLVSVSVAQAADSAAGKAILDRGDVDSSNVGIPGATDTMIGIGATRDMELSGRRMLSFPKNKIGGHKTPLSVFFNTQNMRIE